MNAIAITGIIAAIVISGALGAYAMIESDIDMISQHDIKDIAEDIKEDAIEIDPGFGQVEKNEGVYSP